MESLILGMEWRLPRVDQGEIDHLRRLLRLPAFIVRFLYNRGFRDRDSILSHLSPSLASLNDPFSMADMEPAVERLAVAARQGEVVVIFGDYDVDGVCGAALLHLALSELGIRSRVYIPHRVREGYGLNADAVRRLAREGCRLLLTVDCGISNGEEVELARSLGMDVIVTDHHQPPPELPRAVAVINPKRRDCPYPFEGLAGVGVAFNLVRAVRNRICSGRPSPPNPKKYLDLVALGTVADMVPLLSDNRVLVRAGLEVLTAAERTGVRALKEVAGLQPRGPVTPTDIGFRLGPRINAAGRMAHAMDAFRLLTTRDPAEAQDLAARLHGLNSSRQSMEAAIFREAHSMVQELGERPAYVLWSREWSVGVVGIVASKLMEELRRPVILIADQGPWAKGSGRAPEHLDLCRVLSHCRHLLRGFGGHRAAAGLTLDPNDKEAFRRRFEEVVEEQLGAAPPAPVLEITDGPLAVEELYDPAMASLLSLLEPFGVDYPRPLVALRGFSVVDRRTVGGGRHMKLLLAPSSGRGSGPVPLLGWRHGDKLHLPWEGLEVACSPYVNHYNGRSEVNLELRDARGSRTQDAAP